MVDRGIFDSGCSGHMTGNKDQLEDFEEFKEVAKATYLVPRHHNMYSFDMKTPTPTKGFACLIAKATSDESKLWHRRYFREKLTHMQVLQRKTNNAGTLQTPKSNASEEKEEDVELIVVPSVVPIPEEIVDSRTSSTKSKKEKILTVSQQEEKVSSTDTSEDNPKILAFRRELEEIALKHLEKVSENTIPKLQIFPQSPKTGIVDRHHMMKREPKKISKALQDDSWVQTMQEELLQFKLQQVWVLVDLPHRMKEEGIDYDEVFAPVARIEAIRLFLAFASFMGFIVFQMDVKSAFLYAIIDEEVISSQPPGFVDPNPFLIRESPFDLEAFSDSDYGGSNLDRKSTTGGCQFLGQRLISWQCKKQTIVATSTTEAEYVAAANCCGQVLWVQNQLLDYGFNFMNTKIHIDNESTICIVKHIMDVQMKGRRDKTATTNTIADGTLEIHATIDTIRYTITEASIRDTLQLADATGITMLPNDEIFEGMGQMGYPTDGTFTFWKSFFTPQWRYLVHHLLHCISSKSGGWDQFGSNIATALICLSTVPRLISRIDSLETDLKQTKLTMGNAIVKLVRIEEVGRGRKSQDDPLASLVQGLVTPSMTKVNASGEEQVEDISPNTLEAAKTLSRKKLIPVIKKLILNTEGVNTAVLKLVLVSEQVSTKAVQTGEAYLAKQSRLVITERRAVKQSENILPVAAHEEVETIHNMTAENKLYFQAEKEALFLVLTVFGDEIYSKYCWMHANTAKEMWTATIEKAQTRGII
ncbi:putative ribonuclease H-like domain-containing protein [Tanacetum coccineum]